MSDLCLNSKGESRQRSGLVVIKQATDGPGFEPKVGSPRIFKIDFNLQRLCVITYDTKPEGTLYLVCCAEASKRPWTCLNE